MTEPRVVIRAGQWLNSNDLLADCGGEECLVRLDSAVANDPMLDQLPDRPGSLHSPAEALAIASTAATRAKARGSIDAYGRIAVFMKDLKPEG